MPLLWLSIAFLLGILLVGILLGIDNNIPANVLESFQVTGTAHIIAISGFNNPITFIQLI